MRKLWIDDERNPISGSWDIVRNYNEFKSYIDKHGIPFVISFDHDLGNKDDKTGYDCAMYIIENDMKINDFYVHSHNPIGKYNIYRLLSDYKNGIKPASLNWINK